MTVIDVFMFEMHFVLFVFKTFTGHASIRFVSWAKIIKKLLFPIVLVKLLFFIRENHVNHRTVVLYLLYA